MTPQEEIEAAGLAVRAARHAVLASTGTRDEVVVLIQDFEAKVEIVYALIEKYKQFPLSNRCVAKCRHMIAIRKFLKSRGFEPYEFRVK